MLYNFSAIYLLPVNLYGPGDDFDRRSSHVIPALIKKCIEAVENGKGSIEVWGDGSATREFLYVKDCVEGNLRATERYDKAEPLNLRSGTEISIKYVVQLIADLTGFKGEIRWHTCQPNGQLRRCLDVSRGEAEFGFRAKTRFEDGLRRTIDWYRAQRGLH